MVSLTVGINVYKAPTLWSEISVSKAIKLSNLCKTIPKVLKSKYDLLKQAEPTEEDFTEWQDSLTDKDLLEDMPNFYRKVCKCLIGIEEEITDDSAANIYYQFLELFVVGIMENGRGYDPVRIGSFTFKGVDYLIPSEKKILDTVIPMHDLLMVQFAEASDLINLIGKQGYKFAPTVIAVLCLTKGEIYNEELVLKRSKEFEELDMATVWDVFFCLTNFAYTSKEDLRSYLVRGESRPNKKAGTCQTHGGDLSMIYTQNQGTCYSMN